VAVDTSNIPSEQERAVTQRRSIAQRVDKFGVAEPIIQPAGRTGSDSTPGLSEAEKESAKNQIQRRPLGISFSPSESAQLAAPRDCRPGYELMMFEVQAQRWREFGSLPCEEKDRNRFDGEIRGTFGCQSRSVTGALKINLKFNSEGARLFGDITRENVGHQLAIVLTGSSTGPQYQRANPGRSCEIPVVRPHRA